MEEISHKGKLQAVEDAIYRIEDAANEKLVEVENNLARKGALLVAMLACAVREGVNDQIGKVLGKMGSKDRLQPSSQMTEIFHRRTPELPPHKDLKKNSHKPSHSRTPYYFGP